jgi:hypothetical protein
VAPGDVEVRSRRVGSVHCEIGQAEGIIGCARAKGRQWGERGSSEYLGRVRIGRKRLQASGSPARDSASLAASFQRKKGREERGGVGDL